MSAKLHALGFGASIREPIAADRLVEGAPVAETRIDYEHDATSYVGEWACGVGAWRVTYDEWEYCEMLEGACELVPDDGATMRFSAGDRFVIEPGFRGLWRVLTPMRKRFIIRTR